MGRVRTKTVKRAAKVLLQKHYQKLTNDFHINKRILSEVAKVPTKKLRNKIAGFATHLVKRIQKGPVKGISLRVQQQERQRRLDWVPKQSQIKTDKVTIDTETQNMLKNRFGEDFLNQISTNLQVKAHEQVKKQNKGGKRRGGKDTKRQPKEKKQGQQQAVQPQVAAKTTEKTEQKPKEVKRQGRRRGPRQGQQ